MTGAPLPESGQVFLRRKKTLRPMPGPPAEEEDEEPCLLLGLRSIKLFLLFRFFLGGSSVLAAFVAGLILAAGAHVHHRRGIFIQAVDAYGEAANNFLIDAHVALHFLNRRKRCVQPKHGVMALAVFLDAV